MIGLIILLSTIYLVQLIIVIIMFLEGITKSQKSVLINLIPFGWLYYIYKRYEKLPWDK